MGILMIFSTILATSIVTYYILKQYNPIFVFLFSGIILLILAFYLIGTPIPSQTQRNVEEITFLRPF